jgi:translation initiation factor 2B subunit (eIF-2B alpha/beta/delta family)
VWEVTTLLSPLAGALLQALHEVSERYRWRDIAEYMHMILHAIDGIYETSLSLYYACEIGVQLVLMLREDSTLAGMGAENEMIYILCVTHDALIT